MIRRALAIACSLWLAGPALSQMPPGAGGAMMPVGGPAISLLPSAKQLFLGLDGTIQGGVGYTGSAVEFPLFLGGIAGGGGTIACQNAAQTGDVTCNITSQGAAGVNYGNSGHGTLVQILDPGAGVTTPMRFTPPTAAGALGNIDCGASTLCNLAGVAPLTVSNNETFWALNCNPDFVFDQPNAGIAFTPTNASSNLAADCWRENVFQSSKLTFQRKTITWLAGFTYGESITVASSYTPVSTDKFLLQTAITGGEADALQWGTASAKAATLSFSANSTGLTYPFLLPITIHNNGAGGTFRTYVSLVTLSSAGAFSFNINVPGDTSTTWATATTPTSVGIMVRFGLGDGSNFQTATTDAWQTGQFFTTSGASALVSQANASSLTIAAVHFRAGSLNSAPYVPLPWSQEYARVRARYFSTFALGTKPAQNVGVGTGEFEFAAPIAAAGTEISRIPFNVPMTVGGASTAVPYNPAAANALCRDETAAGDGGAVTSSNVSALGLMISCAGNAGTTAGNAIGLHMTVDSGW